MIAKTTVHTLVSLTAHVAAGAAIAYTIRKRGYSVRHALVGKVVKSN